MNWHNFLTYSDSYQNAFETFCNQLFENYLKRKYKTELTKFRVINGAGGDGGIEAYGQLISNDIIAIQSKWFRQNLTDNEIKQIRKSIETAKQLRAGIKEYIICIPHDIGSIKFGRGKKGADKKPIENFEEKIIDKFTEEIGKKFPDLKLIWWFEKDIESELQQPGNDHIRRFWFDKEIISFTRLEKQFELQRKGWLHARYIPELHSQGVIYKTYQEACFSEEYRQVLLDSINKPLDELLFTIYYLEKFIHTNHNHPDLNAELESIKANLLKFSNALKNLYQAISIGNDFYKSEFIEEILLWDIKIKLEEIKPDNIQKSILPKLINGFATIHQYHLSNYIDDIYACFNKSILLILGEPGTGKTSGLASCVENHLKNLSPAIIIQAKNCPCKDWTDILSTSLDLKDWTKEEILSSLESIAARNDIRKAQSLNPGQELDLESTKVIICIDGLEEDVDKEEEWYARIRECEQLIKDYSRVKFIFSARSYFYDNEKVPNSKSFEIVSLPREGDILIFEALIKYFQFYKITLSNINRIRGLNSLFALRLFCEKYKDTNLDNSVSIITATRELLTLKIDKVNKEYVETLNSKIGKTRNPIIDSLEIISDHFYKNVEVEHNQLVDLIFPTLKSYLNSSDIDLLIDFLSNNGFLIKSEKIIASGLLNKKQYFYNVAYQSIIEHIISGRIYLELKEEKIDHISTLFLDALAMPLNHMPGINASPKLLNRRIIQNIVNDLFIYDGKLIGENNFLSKGFNSKEISEMQLEALINAPSVLAEKYKKKIDAMLCGGYKTLFEVLKYLIIPSTNLKDKYYNAEYLHKFLLTQPSTYTRDKLWSGLDYYEAKKDNEYESFNLRSAIDYTDKFYLWENAPHNEMPLIFAWGLSTFDQEFREKLRISLTKWAIHNPIEYLLLLDEIFFCNDPQIQEDLSSIMLGIASRMKKNKYVKSLAEWSLKNIFSRLDIYKNVIIRQGFRAIVERAYQYGLITLKEVEMSRPKPIVSITLLELDTNVVNSSESEIYPLVHDLAWYVIKKSYNDFLEYPHEIAGKLVDKDSKQAKTLLDLYRNAYKSPGLYANRWGMAAGSSYIKNLGLIKDNGNCYTQATHGSKSKIFTIEEKYTWLAVHYLQGYLSDYVPLKQNKKYVEDYSQLSPIPNPGEVIVEQGDGDFFYKKEWIIKEILSKEIPIETDIKRAIEDWVSEDPDLNFESWLKYDSSDFISSSTNKQWLALYNYSGLHDSKELGYTFLRAASCIIQTDKFHFLLNAIQNTPDDLHFITSIDSLHASPCTDTYCNPSDIMWMTWIDEDDKREILYDSDIEYEIEKALVEVVQESLDGEQYVMLPSKKIRQLIECYELAQKELKYKSGDTIGFIHSISDQHNDRQEITCVDYSLLDKLKKENLSIVWFVDLYKRSSLNKTIEKDWYVGRSRKYFVWIENGEFKNLQFWDGMSTNTRV